MLESKYSFIVSLFFPNLSYRQFNLALELFTVNVAFPMFHRRNQNEYGIWCFLDSITIKISHCSPQPSKTKKTSAQAIQNQKVQSNAVKSKPKTTSVPSSSATASVGKNQSNPLSINQTEKLLDPFSHSKTVKDLTK